MDEAEVKDEDAEEADEEDEDDDEDAVDDSDGRGGDCDAAKSSARLTSECAGDIGVDTALRCANDDGDDDADNDDDGDHTDADEAAADEDVSCSLTTLCCAAKAAASDQCQCANCSGDAWIARRRIALVLPPSMPLSPSKSSLANEARAAACRFCALAAASR